jgi:membrane-associated phospholipid phosphatase
MVINYIFNYIFNYIGFWAPFILFVISIFLLFNYKTYLLFFVSGFVLNIILNIILKLVFKEPRPSTDKKTLETGIINELHTGYDKYGMPSGHAQICSYCFLYLTMVLNNPFISSLYLIISFVSLLQRFLNKEHSLTQVGVGFFIGSSFGLLIYNLANRFIKGNIKRKKDDYAPI